MPSCMFQDSGVNLEEEESRMVAGRERTAAVHTPLPPETFCINRDPFMQKVCAPAVLLFSVQDA